jgi:hypothetical protein
MWLMTSVLLTASLATYAQRPAAGADSHTFIHRMDYYVRDGGEWVSKNDHYKAGSEQAHSYRYRWEWSLGKRIARLHIDGLFDGDKRDSFWESIVVWHPTDGRAVMWQVGAAGAYAEGTVQFTDDKTTEIRLTFYMPDGDIWAFREIDTVVGPDEFRTVSYRFKGGQWTQQGAATWTRLKPDEINKLPQARDR